MEDPGRLLKRDQDLKREQRERDRDWDRNYASGSSGRSSGRDTCRSTSGYVFMVVGGPVTGSSKRQATVALSTVEAEYIAMSRCTQQMVWMHSWLNEVQVEYSVPGLLRGDNCGAIALMKNTKDHGKVKHIDICYHYIWELLQSRAITVEQVSSSDNLADMFTKPLLSEKRSGPVRFFCLFWVNRSRNRLPSLEIQKKPV